MALVNTRCEDLLSQIHGSPRQSGGALKHRFGSSFYENHQDNISKLTQTSLVVAFQFAFEDLMNKVTGISEPLLISFFISGLKPNIRRALLFSRPSSLTDAFALACASKTDHSENFKSRSFNSNPKFDEVNGHSAEEDFCSLHTTKGNETLPEESVSARTDGSGGSPQSTESGNAAGAAAKAPRNTMKISTSSTGTASEMTTAIVSTLQSSPRVGSSLGSLIDPSLSCGNGKTNRGPTPLENLEFTGSPLNKELFNGLANARDSYMENSGFKPNIVTVNTIIHGYCTRGNNEVAHKMFNKMKLTGINPDSYTYTSLISGLCKKGKIEAASNDFWKMEDHDLIPTANALIDGYCNLGKIETDFTDSEEIIVAINLNGAIIEAPKLLVGGNNFYALDEFLADYSNLNGAIIEVPKLLVGGNDFYALDEFPAVYSLDAEFIKQI